MTSRRLSFFTLSVLVVATGLLWLGRGPQPAPTPPAAVAVPLPTMEVQSVDGRIFQVAMPKYVLPVSGAVVTSSHPLPTLKPFNTANPKLQRVADVNVPLPERYVAVNALLAAPLSAFALKEAVSYLRSPVPNDLSAAERERALRNELLNQLRSHSAHEAFLVSTLVSQAADQSQDTGLRDYALQHLAAWGPQLKDAEREQAVSALKTALQEKTHTYAGTALVGLHSLEQQGALGSQFDVAAESLRIALDESISVLSRLTALALAAELKVRDARLESLARSWSSPASPVPEGARRTALSYIRSEFSTN